LYSVENGHGCLRSTPLILRIENTNESQGYVSDSVEDSEAVLNLRKGARQRNAQK
jgi:hypothetical protein